jgi:hypothetical protein
MGVGDAAQVETLLWTSRMTARHVPCAQPTATVPAAGSLSYGPERIHFGERYRQGDTISTAFVESTINQVVSKRFVKRQQMQWSQKGAHLLLQTRTKVLDGDLEGVFRGWYPQFRPVSAASPTL